MKTVALFLMACFEAKVSGLAYQGHESTVAKHKTEEPRFDVVSVKPCPNAFIGNLRTSPGRLHLECRTVDGMLRTALVSSLPELLPNEADALIKGGPGWVRSQRFTIDAMTEKPTTKEQMTSTMLLALLKERFQLKIQEQSATMPIYELVPAPGGAKLKPTKENGCFELGTGKEPPRASGGKPPQPICGGFGRATFGGTDVHGATLRDLCRVLSLSLGRDVVDTTGLQGGYDFHLDTRFDDLRIFKGQSTTPPPAAGGIGDASEPSGGSIPSAVRKLGLTLKAGTRVVKVFEIQRAELPTAN
jgi:uncharacterized protein (TIGR03435 family)